VGQFVWVSLRVSVCVALPGLGLPGMCLACAIIPHCVPFMGAVGRLRSYLTVSLWAAWSGLCLVPHVAEGAAACQPIRPIRDDWLQQWFAAAHFALLKLLQTHCSLVRCQTHCSLVRCCWLVQAIFLVQAGDARTYTTVG